MKIAAIRWSILTGAAYLFLFSINAYADITFDCLRPSGSLEKIVCQNPILKNLNIQINALYRKTLEQKPDQAMDAYRTLYFALNKCDGEYECLKNAYATEIISLGGQPKFIQAQESVKSESGQALGGSSNSPAFISPNASPQTLPISSDNISLSQHLSTLTSNVPGYVKILASGLLLLFFFWASWRIKLLVILGLVIYITYLDLWGTLLWRPETLIGTIILLFIAKHFYKKARVNHVRQDCLGEIQNHIQTLCTKRNHAFIPNEYGFSDPTKWDKEVKKFINQVLYQSVSNLEILNVDDIYELINDAIDEYEINNVNDVDSINDMTGQEYEILCKNELIRFGWKADLTKASGDFGADIVARYQGTCAVIQCKRYSKTIPSSAVSAVLGSIKMYPSANCGVVVSNAPFSPAAYKLAHKNNILLIHHNQLGNLYWLLKGEDYKDNASTSSDESLDAHDQRHWFEILEVAESASFAEIKNAWKRKCSKNHPDRVDTMSEKFKQLAEQEMKLINAAYAHACEIRGK